MFAIAFDLDTAKLKDSHPLRVNRAYDEIRRTLRREGFVWTQGSVYVSPEGGLVQLFDAINALKALPWFPIALRELRAFRLENDADFTMTIKS